MIEYNHRKLSSDLKRMSGISVFNAGGGGAVGSQLQEQEVKMGIGHVTGCDRDCYEPDNFAKCSPIIRFPEDVGRSKAQACADRLRAIAPTGCVVSSITADLSRLGPRAYTLYDYVFNALDNTTAKMIMNRSIRRLPPEERPTMLSCGTNGENSAANVYVEGGSCLRCDYPDEWLDEPDRSWSCTGNADYLLPTNGPGIIATSGRASAKSAIDATDLMEAHLKGHLPKGESMRVVQSTFPYKNLSVTRLEKRCDCPDCQLEPPDSWTELNGCSYTLSLRKTFEMISESLGHDGYYIRVYELILPDRSGDRCYNQFVTHDRCRICGKPIPVFRHTGRIRDDQIVCESCHNADLDSTPVNREFDDTGMYLAFRPGKCEDILDRTLYELGFPIGAYIEVEIDKGHLSDENDTGTRIFVCSEDPAFIYNSEDLVLE